MAGATQMAEVQVAHSAAMDRLMGYVIVCAAPALFWSLMLAAGAWTFNVAFTPSALAICALAVASFLAIVFSALGVHAKS